MRDMTKEESEAYEESLRKIYKPTGVNLNDLMEEKSMKNLQKSIKRCSQRIHSYEDEINNIRISKNWISKFPMDCFRVDDEHYGFYSGESAFNNPRLGVSWHKKNDCGTLCFDSVYLRMSSSKGDYVLHLGSMDYFKIIENHKQEILNACEDDIHYYEKLINLNKKNIAHYEEQLGLN